MKVYILSSGEYSDYTIIGIFSNREEAEAVRREAVYPDNRGCRLNQLSECEVDEPLKIRWTMDREIIDGNSSEDSFNTKVFCPGDESPERFFCVVLREVRRERQKVLVTALRVSGESKADCERRMETAERARRRIERDGILAGPWWSADSNDGIAWQVTKPGSEPAGNFVLDEEGEPHEVKSVL